MIQRIPVVEKILSANDRLAEHKPRQGSIRPACSRYNIMASPGAGKTSR